MVSRSIEHERFVDEWLASRARAMGTGREVAEVLLIGIHAIWNRARVSLGEVTLAAVFEQVLQEARARYPIVRSIDLRVADMSRIEADTSAAVAVDGAELGRAARFVLVHSFYVLGRLTGETLSPALHAAFMASASASSHRA